MKWARPCDPIFPAPRRLRGSKALGLAYENALARALPEWKHGEWFEFDGGACQFDFLTISSDEVWILEAKLSYTDGAWSQLDKYCRVAHLAFQRPSFGVLVCKHLAPPIARTVDAISGSLRGAQYYRKMGLRSVWHCIDPKHPALAAAA